MDREIDIVEIIKSRRFFHLAMHKLLSYKDRLELKERSRYILIDPEEIDVEEARRLKAKMPGAKNLSHATTHTVD